MRNPCLVCEFRDLDKNRPECVGCDRRVTYVSSMGSLSCSVPEITTIGHIRQEAIRQPADVICKTKTEETKMKKTKICKNTDCPHGGKPQDLQEAFHKQSKAADGRNPICKTCRAKIAREARYANLGKGAAAVEAAEEVGPVEEVKADSPVLVPEILLRPTPRRGRPILPSLPADGGAASSFPAFPGTAFYVPGGSKGYQLDFTDYPWLKDKLDLSAKAEFRTPEMQVLYLLSQFLEDGKEEAA